MLQRLKVEDIRAEFRDLYSRNQFVTDKTGVRTLEILNAAFIADEETIFGPVNHDYVAREIEWYKSESLNVNDIPGKIPEMWKKVADRHGNINSNYGWCIWSAANGGQYRQCLNELIKNPNSRRAIMIYTRPSMHHDAVAGGRSDFMCTNAVQYVIRDGFLHAIVSMRSNDAWAGYRNDFSWQRYVHVQLIRGIADYGGPILNAGNIYWNAASLHLYERQFHLITPAS